MFETSKPALDDGGNAFPSGIMGLPQGMSLRDWFAGQAVPSLLAQYYLNDLLWESIAPVAYRVADDLIAARSKGGLCA